MREEELLYKSALERLSTYLREHDKRVSDVRNYVLAKVCQLKQPFTETQLEEVCQAERISKATVYNALRLFVAANIIKIYDRGYGQTVKEYELTTSASRSHMQIICRKCGRRVYFYDKAVTRVLVERNYTNFQMQNFTLVVYGECKICRVLTAMRRQKRK